jgi:hypothetical protein
MMEALQEWLASPIGLVAVGLLGSIVATGGAAWLAFQNRDAAFWKRSDYWYLTATLLGGALTASHFAISSWESNSEQ